MTRDYQQEKVEIAKTPMSHPVWRQKWTEFQLQRTGVIAQECPTCGFADPQTIRDFVEWLLEDQRKEAAKTHQVNE